MNSILERLEMTAQNSGWEAGIDDGNVFMSWKDVLEIARKIGSALAGNTRRGMPVAVLMEKSAFAVAAMFGVLYAGCFYTMIDPGLPDNRIAEMLNILEPALILTDLKDGGSADRFAECGRVMTIRECLRSETNMELLEDIRRKSNDTDTLYCMFTSGSTGSPKGISVSSRAVSDFITHFVETVRITKEDRIGNQAPFDFDVSVKDIYSCVFTGATLVTIPQKLFATPPCLLDYLCEKKITTLIWAVSALTLISSLKGLQYRVPKDVRKVMFSGEVMPAKQLRLWQEALPDARFINLYGPTEITCNCTYYPIDRRFADDERLPIGIPFPGREVFIADENGNEIREAERVGEICIAGESLSDGYYHNPKETEKRFRRKSDGRLYYSSGDLGYRGTDGLFYFSGRADFQVKIMGRRIELEEVEHSLARMEGVDRACCLVRRERSQIIACYTGEAEPKSLREDLRKYLPFYMVPQKIIRVDDIPLNKNGKTDRKRMYALLEAGSQ